MTFKINPKGTSITKLTAGTKAFTAVWKKQAVQTTGYQIQYSLIKNFKSGNRAKTISKPATLKLLINKLTKGKTYYVRIRTY
ncbi:MAG: fibronectin type III domain-containing protein, partial [Lachnospiraceae bacterium]|nr:fibronectin type III domain-containing protein [Lachnospiraceae bacterium]